MKAKLYTTVSFVLTALTNTTEKDQEDFFKETHAPLWKCAHYTLNGMIDSKRTIINEFYSFEKTRVKLLRQFKKCHQYLQLKCNITIR